MGWRTIGPSTPWRQTPIGPITAKIVLEKHQKQIYTPFWILTRPPRTPPRESYSRYLLDDLKNEGQSLGGHYKKIEVKKVTFLLKIVAN